MRAGARLAGLYAAGAPERVSGQPYETVWRYARASFLFSNHRLIVLSFQDGGMAPVL